MIKCDKCGREGGGHWAHCPTEREPLPVESQSAGSIHKAKAEAVEAIYFDDSSDYRTALMNVVKHLDPELYDLMLIDRKAAFKKISELNDPHHSERD